MCWEMLSKTKYEALTMIFAIIILILGTDNLFARDSVWVWYGDLSASPISAELGDTLYVDVYIQTAEAAYVGDMHLALGANTDYIEAMISDSVGQVYYPLTLWQSASFLRSEGSPPNPSGWISQSFMGFAALSPMEDTPWLHSETASLVMTMACITNSDQSLSGQTIEAFGAGTSAIQGTTNIGDTLGNEGYEPVEYYSQISFADNSGYLSGVVIDTSGEYLSGIMVADADLLDSDTTDINGEYLLQLPEGVYSIYFDGVGFKDTVISGIAIDEGLTTELDVVMQIDSTEYNNQLPATIEITGNYPNPFNGRTIIEFNLQKAMAVDVEIFDILGRRVKNIGSFSAETGINQVIWQPQSISSGIYFCRIRSGSNNEAKAMLYIK